MSLLNRIAVFRQRHNVFFALSLLGAVIAALMLLAYVFVDVVPPRSATYGALDTTKRRIARYYAANHALPERLEDLPQINGIWQSTKDAWGRQVTLRDNHDGSVSLISLGKDGVPGGEGDDADMVGTFDPSADEYTDWQVDPFGRLRVSSSTRSYRTTP